MSRTRDYRRFDPTTLHLEVELGHPCHIAAHEATLAEGKSFRYADTKACVQCVRELTKPGLSIDVNRIRQDRVAVFLRFWSMVSIAGPDDCWTWENPADRDQASARLFPSHSRRQEWVSPSRAAIWFSWGDTALLPFRRLCGTTRCCNPLHLRVQQVPHFVYRRKIDQINLRRAADRLEPARFAYTRELLLTKDPSIRQLEQANPHWVALVARSLEEEGSGDMDRGP